MPLNTYREAHYETEGVKRTTVKTACCYPPFQRLNLMFKLLVNLPEHINQLWEYRGERTRRGPTGYIAEAPRLRNGSETTLFSVYGNHYCLRF